jgi:hypothetical protein
MMTMMANPKIAMAQGPCKNRSHSGMKVRSEAPTMGPAMDPDPPIINMHTKRIEMSA